MPKNFLKSKNICFKMKNQYPISCNARLYFFAQGSFSMAFKLLRQFFPLQTLQHTLLSQHPLNFSIKGVSAFLIFSRRFVVSCRNYATRYISRYFGLLVVQQLRQVIFYWRPANMLQNCKNMRKLLKPATSARISKTYLAIMGGGGNSK